MGTIRTVFAGIKKTPGKTLMTLLAVGLGVMVLISSLNISSIFSSFVEEELLSGRVIINAANAEYSDEGGLTAVRPSEFDGDLLQVIRNEVPGVTAVSPAAIPHWDLQLKTGDAEYRIRTILGVNEEYLTVMDLSLVTGSFFTTSQISEGTKKAVLSRDLAERIYGSVDAALGEIVRPPQIETSSGTGGNSGGQGEGSRRKMVLPSYEVIGVYELPTELKRKSFGIGDALVPYTSLLPAGFDPQTAAGFLLSTVTISAEGSSVMVFESRLREVLGREYGEDITLHIWEGTPRGAESVLEETRKSLRTITVVINLLGFILLTTGSIGILSIMIVEVAGRSREIAMKQALGAHKGILLKEFWARGVVLSLLSSALGVALSLVLFNPLKDIVVPIFADIGTTEVTGTFFQPFSLIIGVGAAVLFGGVFGILPVFSALKVPITQGIREV